MTDDAKGARMAADLDTIRELAEATLEHDKGRRLTLKNLSDMAGETGGAVENEHFLAAVDEIRHARTAAPELAHAVLELVRYRQAVTEVLDEMLNTPDRRMHFDDTVDRIRAAIARKLGGA